MGIKVRIQLLSLEGEANTPNVFVYNKSLRGEVSVKQLNPGYMLDGKANSPECQYVDVEVDEHTDIIVRAGDPPFGVRT